MRSDIMMQVLTAERLGTKCRLPLADCCAALGITEFAAQLKATLELTRYMTDSEVDEYSRMVCGICGPVAGPTGPGPSGPTGPGPHVVTLAECLDTIKDLICKEPNKTIVTYASAGAKLIAIGINDPTVKNALLTLAAIADMLLKLCTTPEDVKLSDVQDACDKWSKIEPVLSAVISTLPDSVVKFMKGDIVAKMKDCCGIIPKKGGVALGPSGPSPSGLSPVTRPKSGLQPLDVSSSSTSTTEPIDWNDPDSDGGTFADEVDNYDDSGGGTSGQGEDYEDDYAGGDEYDEDPFGASPS